MLYLCALVVSLVSVVGGDLTCIQDESNKSPCVCMFNNGSKIDLRSIKERLTTNEDNIHDSDPNVTYYFNPCYPFTIGNGCDNVLLCQENTDDGSVIPLGKKDHVFFGTNEDDDNIYINYEEYDKNTGTSSNSKVFLKCDKDSNSPTFKLNDKSENPSIYTYKFQLTSKCACADGCKIKPAGHKSKGDPGIVGIILLSILVAGVLVYFITGSAIMKFKYQATGSDVIPNKLFWMSLPSLVKDGVVFTVSPCVKICQHKGYTKVDD